MNFNEFIGHMYGIMSLKKQCELNCSIKFEVNEDKMIMTLNDIQSAFLRKLYNIFQFKYLPFSIPSTNLNENRKTNFFSYEYQFNIFLFNYLKNFKLIIYKVINIKQKTNNDFQNTSDSEPNIVDVYFLC